MTIRISNDHWINFRRHFTRTRELCEESNPHNTITESHGASRLDARELKKLREHSSSHGEQTEPTPPEKKLAEFPSLNKLLSTGTQSPNLVNDSGLLSLVRFFAFLVQVGQFFRSVSTFAKFTLSFGSGH